MNRSDMGFISHLSLPLFRPSRPSLPSLPSLCSRSGMVPKVQMTNTNDEMSKVPKSTLPTPIYGSEEDVCTFGAECYISPECASSSPAISRLAEKYVFPIRENHSQVFFDNSVDNSKTLIFVFAEDRHGLILDVVSVLKAVGVRVGRVANGENEAVRLLMSRCEGEVVSLRGLNLKMDNCVAFWASDEETGEKIFDDSERLGQISECLKIELNGPYPRPRAKEWLRVCVQKDRASRYTVLSLQTKDCSGLLAAVTSGLDEGDMDVASASINTRSERVENHFFVTKRGYKEPLKEKDIQMAVDKVLEAVCEVGGVDESKKLWYQTRDGTEMLIAEAIFIDQVDNQELGCFRFSQFETPNFRGRLPDAPYQAL